MFDFKSLFERAVENKAIDIQDYIFMPERIDMIIDGGNLTSILNSNGKIDFIYTKMGVTEVQSAMRKSPFTRFETELGYGVYDDLIDEVIEKVNTIVEKKSKYFTDTHIMPAVKILEH